MLIAISGTPGTGKTSVAKILSRHINARLITAGYLLKKYKIKTRPDRERKTKIIDQRRLGRAAKKESAGRLCIFEGHLSHFAPADIIIILRTSPAELERRLKRKGWSFRKIKENVEAEAIGIISSEANGVEIDTTRLTPEKTVKLIKDVLAKYPKKFRSKKIDWASEYKRYLERN